MPRQGNLKFEKSKNCPICKKANFYEWKVPGGGTQLRCQPCDYFIEFVELPPRSKKKSEE